MVKEISFKKGEFWYGGATNDGYLFPLTDKDIYSIDLTYNDTYNQVNPLYVSSEGRYIWLENAGKISFDQGKITISADEIEIFEDGKTLKEAQLVAMERHFKPNGLYPAEISFKAPQICTWIYMMENQNEKGVLEYAKTYINSGGKPGVLIIDDTWQQAYGDWDFNEERFGNPKQMIDILHQWGFKVVLWLVPYVHTNTKAFQELKHKDVFIEENGRLLECTWWQGTGYALDFYKPKAREWFKDQIQRLKKEYGVDGFKLDGGDGQFYGKEYALSNEQNRLWSEAVDISKDKEAIVELRACYKNAGKNFMSRLADKAHIWGVNKVKCKNHHDDSYLQYGLSTLIPDMLTQSLTGYYYGCPDMVGGGLNSTFDNAKLDNELLIRSLQCSMALPMMQFSYALWNVKENRLDEHFKRVIDIREKLVDYIVELAKNASVTGEPIIRYMEYEYPKQGLENINDQFLLGNKYLVAPIIQKGQTSKTICFPKETKWKDILTGIEYNEQKVSLAVDINTILIFEKII